MTERVYCLDYVYSLCLDYVHIMPALHTQFIVWITYTVYA